MACVQDAITLLGDCGFVALAIGSAEAIFAHARQLLPHAHTTENGGGSGLIRKPRDRNGLGEHVEPSVRELERATGGGAALISPQIELKRSTSTSDRTRLTLAWKKLTFMGAW